MRRVIHLSDEAYETAKRFCDDNGLFMTYWVGLLIQVAVAGSRGFRGCSDEDFAGGPCASGEGDV